MRRELLTASNMTGILQSQQLRFVLILEEVRHKYTEEAKGALLVFGIYLTNIVQIFCLTS